MKKKYIIAVVFGVVLVGWAGYELTRPTGRDLPFKGELDEVVGAEIHLYFYAYTKHTYKYDIMLDEAKMLYQTLQSSRFAKLCKCGTRAHFIISYANGKQDTVDYMEDRCEVAGGNVVTSDNVKELFVKYYNMAKLKFKEAMKLQRK